MPAGLIEQQLNKNAPLATVQGYDASTVEMGDEDSVEQRTASIISKDSPLQQQDVTRALQQKNKSGLLNTSMAIGSAQGARYDRALQMAVPDANTSATFKLNNQQATNASRQFNASQSNQARALLETGNQSLAQIAAQGSETRKNIGSQADADSGLLAQRGQIDKELQQLLGAQSLQQIDAQGDVESRLTAQRGEIEKALQSADAATREKLLGIQGQIDQQLQELAGSQALEQIGAQSAAEQELLQQRGEIEKQLQAADAASREQLLEQQGQIDFQIQQLRGEQEQALQQQASNYQFALQELKGDQAETLTQIEAQSANLRQASQSAAITFAQSMESMAQILSQPEIAPATKQQLINHQITMLDNSMAVLGSMSNLNLTDLLIFNAPQLTGTGTDVVVQPGTNLGDDFAEDNSSGGTGGGTGSEDKRKEAEEDNKKVIEGEGEPDAGGGGTPEPSGGGNNSQPPGYSGQGDIISKQNEFANKMRELRGSSSNEAEAVGKMLDYAVQQGYNKQQTATMLGMSEQQVDYYLAQIGRGFPGQGGVPSGYNQGGNTPPPQNNYNPPNQDAQMKSALENIANTAKTETEAINSMYNILKQGNYNINDAARALGYTPQQIQQFLAQVGKSL